MKAIEKGQESAKRLLENAQLMIDLAVGFYYLARKAIDDLAIELLDKLATEHLRRRNSAIHV